MERAAYFPSCTVSAAGSAAKRMEIRGEMDREIHLF
jgi:hypothetical protein